MTLRTVPFNTMPGVRSFEYHCAHTFWSLREVSEGIFGDEGVKASDARSEADGTAAERITALAQTIANGKICRIKYGSYTGNGKYGAANAVSIECGFYPLLVMVSEQSDTQHWAVRGVSGFYNSNNRGNAAIWDNSSVSWFCQQEEDQYFAPPAIQFNEAGKTYYYVVLGCDAD